MGIFPSACVDVLKGNPENLPLKSEDNGEESEEEELGMLYNDIVLY